jgi:S1-C subfamily serine protease
LGCAVALINTERGSGTGFFIDKSGNMVTASHVVSQKGFKVVNNAIDFDVTVDKEISVTPHDAEKVKLDSSAVDVDKQESSMDLAFIKTNIKPPCWIPIGDDKKADIGDHLLAIGFPGSDNGNPGLYEGFLSGRFKHPPNPVANAGGIAITPNYEILKVQMPVTAGVSGSPVIDDSGKAIGVVSEIPIIWTQDLENISKVWQTNTGVRLSGFDVTRTLGELAVVVREFESPGSGYAVPISDLKPERAASQKHATSSR